MDRFFIAPYDKGSGLQNDVKPFLIPDQAFASLDNAYSFRGRMRKRFGSRWLGDTQQLTRLRMSAGTLDDPTLLPVIAGGIGAIGQMFSIANVLFTVNQLGYNDLLIANGSTGALGLATFDTATGDFTFLGILDANGNPVPLNTVIYFYPALPVMGLITYEQPTFEDELTIAFDTHFSYQYNNGWDRITAEAAGNAGASIWYGSNSQFFWGYSYIGADPSNYNLYVTNFNQNEPNHMRYLSAGTWNNFYPQIASTANGSPANIFLNSALILVPFKNRLVAFNVWEDTVPAMGPTVTVNYSFRARWSAVGDPRAAGAWFQDVPGSGSGRDCPVNQAITTVEFIKDRLIVYFENSTWEFVYTGNQIYPFDWQQINEELGAESTFSIVPFDQIALGVGNVGIHACNGTNVVRIDTDIPDEVFDIHHIDGGIQRVYGIRDYFVEMVYWTFPDSGNSPQQPYPARILVYNYKNKTWAFNDDSITCFGYFQPISGVTWDSLTVLWDSDESWDSGTTQALNRNVIGGNQQGWTFIIDADEPTNAPALQITDITIASPGSNIITIVCIDNNMRDGDFVYLESIVGTGNLSLLNNKVYKINLASTQTTFTITYIDSLGTIIAGTYQGAGTVRRMSQWSLVTKQFNFYMQQGRNAYINEIDFQVDATAYGAMIVDYYVSTNPKSMLESSFDSGSLLGTGTVSTAPYPSKPFEKNAERLIHNTYIQANGEYIQLNISMSDAQMMTVIQTTDSVGNIIYTGPAFEDFQLHSMCFFATPSASRMR